MAVVSFSNIPGWYQGKSYPPSNQGSGMTDGARMGSVTLRNFNDGVSGVAITPYVTTVMPNILSSNSTLQSVSLSATYTSGTNIPIPLNATSSAAGGNAVIKGQFVKVLDVPRSIRATYTGTALARDVTVWGYDVWGQPMMELFTTSASVQYTQGQKIFKYVSNITISSAITGSSIGFSGGSEIGLSYLSPSFGTTIVYLNKVICAKTTDPTDVSINYASGNPAVRPIIIQTGYTAGLQGLSTPDPRGWFDIGVATSGELIIHQAVLGAADYDSANPQSNGVPGQSSAGLYGNPQYFIPYS